VIIAYPKYFIMPVIMEDDFELNHTGRTMYRNEDIDKVNQGYKEKTIKDEFKEIDYEYINEEIRQRHYNF